MSKAKQTVTGESIEDVEFKDGTKSRFGIRELNMEELFKFCDHVRDGKRFELVVLCTGQPPDQVNRLTPACFAKLWTVAFNRNFPLAGPMIGADPSLAAEVLPVIQKMGIGAALMLSMDGSESSRARAQEASAEVTGTESSSSPQVDSTQSLTNAMP